MSTSFDVLLDYCMLALGDAAGATWPRATTIIPWANEAIVSFPIKRPMQDDHTVAGSATHSITLPTDFREVVSVEYPINQSPKVYLTRKNKYDEDFYSSDDYFDIEHDFPSSDGWMLWLSKEIPVGEHVKTNYLATHKVDDTDDPANLITVPDEYVHILIAYVVVKACRERLGHYMQDPSVYVTIIAQMTRMVSEAEKHYNDLVATALSKLGDSHVSQHNEVDKFDRVY